MRTTSTPPVLCNNVFNDAHTIAEAAPDFALEQAILKHMIPTRGDIDAAFLSQFR